MQIAWDEFGWEPFATLVVGLATVAAALLIGLRQLQITRAQTDIQRSQVAQKNLELRIMLFERRLDVWTQLNEAVEGRMREILNERLGEPKWPVSESLRHFWVLSREASLLFSPAVSSKVRELEALMLLAAQQKARLKSVPAENDAQVREMGLAFQSLEETRAGVEELKTQLFELVSRETTVERRGDCP